MGSPYSEWGMTGQRKRGGRKAQTCCASSQAILGLGLVLPYKYLNTKQLSILNLKTDQLKPLRVSSHFSFKQTQEVHV